MARSVDREWARGSLASVIRLEQPNMAGKVWIDIFNICIVYQIYSSAPSNELVFLRRHYLRYI